MWISRSLEYLVNTWLRNSEDARIDVHARIFNTVKLHMLVLSGGNYLAHPPKPSKNLFAHLKTGWHKVREPANRVHR